MTTELTYLALVSLFTAVAWIPNILDSFLVRGISATVGSPENPPPLSPWAQRAKAAHANASANLPIFAAAILLVHVAGASNQVTAAAAMIYFWARVAHFVVFTLKIGWLRTVSFLIAFACQVAILLQLF